MNSRFEEMRILFKYSNYFKLVCGAGNENAEEVHKLSIIYTLAGANGFDVSAKPEIVKASIAGIDKAYELAEGLKIKILNRPFITVSVGMPGDRHVRKAFIKLEQCIECNSCISVCPTKAIPDSLIIIRDLCIGCGHCEAVCPPKANAIVYEHDEKVLSKILPACLDAGAENIELHAAVLDNETILKEWKLVSDIQPNHYISMCLDRFHLSNMHLIERIKQAAKIAGERLIIQADGVPMSGGIDNFNTTLQAIAIADVINKNLMEKERKFLQLPILLSGGTNGQTANLAKMCNVKYSGVSIGTHARKIVQQNVDSENFYSDKDQLLTAVTIAKNLVIRSLNI